jgi:hypothetical protein
MTRFATRSVGQFSLATLAIPALFAVVFLGSCATEAGDTPACPSCNNTTELLVGAKCVPIAQVEACGPNGHAHGGECHCFDEKDSVVIGGKSYCLQSCGAATTPKVEDVDLHACEHIGDLPVAATAVEAFAEFDTVHVEHETVTDVALPAGKGGYLHFEGHETGHVVVYVSPAGALAGVMDANQAAVGAENEGANEDCPTEWPEVWHVAVVNATGTPQPQILKLNPVAGDKVRLLVLEEGGHDD